MLPKSFNKNTKIHYKLFNDLIFSAVIALHTIKFTPLMVLR